MTPPGKVYLVGAGPGDPGLITVRGRDCLARADAVVYDALVHPALLDYAPGAERIFVGKQRGRHSLSQDTINRILVEKAREAARVVRLKGGDPFVFGRGGEEAMALQAAGVPFEVVPGVTAGIAAPAYAGIPVTHRGLAASMTLVTGHPREGAMGLGAIAAEGTLVFYMGTGNLAAVVGELLRLGRDPDTPAAAVAWGTYARQRTVTAPLTQLEAAVREAGLEPPAVVVVGAVAGLRDTLNWFEARPLHGLRVAVTHTRRRQGALEQQLRELGADVMAFPTVAFEAAAEPGPPADLATYDWVVLTSVNAVEMLFELLARQGRDARALAGSGLCVPGTPAVIEAVRARFLEPDVVVEAFGGDATRDALAARGPLRAKRVLLPRADIARGSIAGALREAGADVHELVAWRSTLPRDAGENVAGLVRFDPGLVVFTSAAAARNFARLPGLDLARLRARAAFASLGPVTSHALAEHGIAVDVQPAQPALAHLVESIAHWAGTRGAGPQPQPGPG